MSRFWSRVALLSALNVCLGAGLAAAQTVVVRHAPEGAVIEVRWNDASAGKATAGAGGTASISLPPGTRGQAQTDARVLVDVCDAARQVRLVERVLQPSPPEPGCRRSDLGQFVLLQDSTSIMVDLAQATPALWVRQGPVPPEWMTNLAEGAESRPRLPAPKGIILSADTGFTRFGSLGELGCGGVTDCSAKAFRSGFGFGAAYWPSQYFGVEAGYLRPSQASMAGDGGTYQFDTTLETQVLMATAVVGIPVGPVRFFGRGGTTHHRATLHTSQTMEDRTITIKGVPQTVSGGTQEFELRTGGWGWVFGGGMEVWASRSFAIFGEANYGALKGGARDDGEGALDERTTLLRIGVRFRIPS